ncbi:MAG: hypothetical protein OSJ45_11085 [Lachnospiraceae bacterium]|nr:hypothetical protein [Lachnospiraceae bacterium]
MERLTKRIGGYAHGAEGRSEDNLTGAYCRGEFEAAACVEKLAEYEDIGTVEECREARERQRGKKVNNRTLLRDLNGNPYTVRGDCPNCGNVNLVEINTSYCNTCGQKLDWNE